MTMNIKQLEECLTNRNWKNLGAMAISYIYADGQTSRRPNNRRLLDINGPWGHLQHISVLAASLCIC